MRVGSLVVAVRPSSYHHNQHSFMTMHQGLGFGVTAEILNFEGALLPH